MEPTSPLDYAKPAASDSRSRLLTLVAVVTSVGACLCLVVAATLRHTGFTLLPPDTAMPIVRGLVLLSPLLGIAAALTSFFAALRHTGAWEVAATIATIAYWAGLVAVAFFGLL